MKSPAEAIIDKFGGLASLARALGHKHPTTVQGWKERGVIPQRHHDEVLDAAEREGISLERIEFLEVKDEKGGSAGAPPALEAAQ